MSHMPKNQVNLIHCNTCQKTGQVTFENMTSLPTAPVGWQVLFAHGNWEYECPHCWAAYLQQTQTLKQAA